MFPSNFECTLPFELWENILNFLKFRDLLIAADVCHLWSKAVTRICRNRCLNMTCKKLLDEILDIEEQERYCQNTEERDWKEVYRLSLSSNISRTSYSVLRDLSFVKYLTSAGSYLVSSLSIDDQNESIITIYEPNASLLLECCTQISMHGRIQKVSLLTLPDHVFCICTKDVVLFYLFSRIKEKNMLMLTSSCTLKPDFRLCCCENLIATVCDSTESDIIIYSASIKNKETLYLTSLAKIGLEISPFFWNIWKSFVTLVLVSGHVVVYKIKAKDDNSNFEANTEEVWRSDMWKDLRYPNPTYFYRGIILSSTLTARTLLGLLLVYKIYDDASEGFWKKSLESEPFLILPLLDRPVSKVAAIFRHKDVVVALSSSEGNCKFVSIPYEY